MTRDQISCRERRTEVSQLKKTFFLLFWFTVLKATWQATSLYLCISRSWTSHPRFCGSGTTGPCRTSPATEEFLTGARRTHSRSPTRPPGDRTGCPPPVARGPDTSEWPHSLCSSHRDQLIAAEMKVVITSLCPPGGKVKRDKILKPYWGSWQSQSHRVWWLGVWWWECSPAWRRGECTARRQKVKAHRE